MPAETQRRYWERFGLWYEQHRQYLHAIADYRKSENYDALLRVIRSVAERRMTMIVVTHELQFAHDVSDQVIFLERGVVAESGTPDELFLHPKNDRTRQFLAAYVK